jgi:hypothetical protein
VRTCGEEAKQRQYGTKEEFHGVLGDAFDD